jgi:hypothetical protein
MVGGDTVVLGNFIANTIAGSLLGTISADNVTTGIFPAGDYTFTDFVAVNTSTRVGIPQELSVYGDEYVSGNVGVGVSAPGYKIDVSGGDINTAGVYRQGGTNIGMSSVTCASGSVLASTTIRGGIVTNGSCVTLSAGGGGGAWTRSGTSVYLTTSSDKVGIGTSTPTSKLDVVVGTTAGTGVRFVGTDNRYLGEIVNRAVGAAELEFLNTNQVYINRVTTNVIARYSGLIGIEAPLDAGTAGLHITSVAGDGNASTPQVLIDPGATQVSPAFQIQNTAGQVSFHVAASGGNVGVGSSTAVYKLDVAGGDINVAGAGVYRRAGVAGITRTCSAGQVLATTTVAGGIITGGDCVTPSGGGGGVGTVTTSSQTTNYLTKFTGGSAIGNSTVYDNGTAVGVGAGTTPDTNLHVEESNADTVPAFEVEQLSTGDAAMIFSIAGRSFAFGMDNSDSDKLKISTAAAAGTAVLGTGDLMTIQTNGWVGIGTSSPQALLSVGTTTSALVAIFGGGAGKIDVGTVDPIYTIGGRQYATYLPAMTGVKEETAGVIRCEVKGERCEADLDFENAAVGSDLWLFSRTTDLGTDYENLIVLLTPGFDGRAWYEKDASAGTVTVFAEPLTSHLSPLEVSYRLTAPRFDASEWPNLPANPSGPGFVLDK